MVLVVNVSDARVSSDAQDVLVTYSLGSCIGVSLYDPATHVGGMLHYQLPCSSIDPARARTHPLMYADTGMQVLLEQMQARGADKRRMKVKLAGAAQMLDDKNFFNIGRRNHAAIRKIFWQHGMFIDAEDVGGVTPRTLYLHLSDGGVIVKSNGATKTL
jgi:chemotaxis protein CheD